MRMSLLIAPTRLRVYAWCARAPGLAASFATHRKGPHGEAITLEAPPLEEFQKVFRHLRAGQSLRHGVDGVGGRKRANKLSWSLAEALRESDTKFVMDRAHCLWIARDARQGRLLFPVSYTHLTLPTKRIV